MKFMHVLTAAALALLAAAPLSVSAENETIPFGGDSSEEETFVSADGAYSYGLDENGGARLYDFKQSDTFEGELIVPSEVDGHPVVYLGNAVYMNTTGATSVTLPATITSSGDSMFWGCTGITSFAVEEGSPYFSVDAGGALLGDNAGIVLAYPTGNPQTSYTVPDSVNEIGPSVFAYASMLDEVIIPEGVTHIDKWAFAYTQLESITLPDSMVQIDDYGFAYCQSLRNVDLGEGLQFIYHAAFAECRALSEITFPDTLTVVGQYAFCGTSLKSVTLPAGITTIDYGAFGYNSSMQPISGFTIYGQVGSLAQSYCYTSDPDNDYENNFNFVAIDENGETLAVEDTSEAADDASEAETQPNSDTTDASNKNQPLLIALGVLGGVAAVLIAVLAVMMKKKPKSEGQEKK